ncbi:MAG: hypothetical protein SGI72_08865 [Planctomycetota bacterium]|nr:hypothetical protein [Planctomycetota bacterium]
MKRAVGVLASLIFLLVLAEIACRIDALFPLAPFDSTQAHLHFVVRQNSGADQTLALYSAPDPQGEATSVRPVPHPFFGWTSERDVHVVDEQLRWFSSKESETCFDVIVLGGSVAAEFTNMSGPTLAAALALEPKLDGRTVRVWNDAHAAFKAPQTGNELAYLLALGLQPDAVLLIDGFNEVAIGMTNALAGSNPALPSFEVWSGLARGKAVDAHALDLLVTLHSAQRAEQAVARTAVKGHFAKSALLTRITLARLAAKHATFRDALESYLDYTKPRADDPAVSGTHFDATPEAVGALATRVWSENARLVEALCRARDIPLVHVLQPTLYDPGAKVMTPEETRAATAASAWMVGVHAGYPKLRAAGSALQRDGFSFRDLSRVFATQDERLFVDVCHMNARGYTLFAAEIAAEFARVSKP